jgi:phosphoserine phosphatase RsbU/P
MLNPSTDVLRISSAGHPPPILAYPEGETTTVGIAVDVALGVVTGHSRHTTKVSLPRGGVLCLYSDGLVERPNVVIDENIERLRTAVTAQASEAVCVDVMQQLVGFDNVEDDVAVLVMRRLPTSQLEGTNHPAPQP